MAETTVKPRAFAVIVPVFRHALGNPALFVAHVVNIRQTSSCWDSARLCSPCGEVGTHNVSTVSPALRFHAEPWVGNNRESLQKCANMVIVNLQPQYLWWIWPVRDL